MGLTMMVNSERLDRDQADEGVDVTCGGDPDDNTSMPKGLVIVPRAEQWMPRRAEARSLDRGEPKKSLSSFSAALS
jgi:hypothetical protein